MSHTFILLDHVWIFLAIQAWLVWLKKFSFFLFFPEDLKQNLEIWAGFSWLFCWWEWEEGVSFDYPKGYAEDHG